MDPKIINNTCNTEENGTATCINGKLIGIGKEKSIIFLFCLFSRCNHENNQYTKIVIAGQINIAANGEYLLWRFQVVIADKS